MCTRPIFRRGSEAWVRGYLKSMLRKFVNSREKDWDQYIPYLLFAYREVPQESTGFSPFELLFGRLTSLQIPPQPSTASCGSPCPILLEGPCQTWLAPAAYISSLDQSKELVSRILGHLSGTSVHESSALYDLAVALRREDWTSIEEVDIPLRQRHLSKCIDQAGFGELCTSASLNGMPGL